MWKVGDVVKNVGKYLTYKNVNKIYLINNNPSQTPSDFNLIAHTNLEEINYGRNIYVNPAWNEGYYRSKADVICFLNDDVFVEESVFDYIANLDFTDIDIIGAHLKGSVDNFHIVQHPDLKEELIKLNVDKSKPIGGQAYAFGVCMFIKRTSYKEIPSLYQIWYGDDYLIQNNENIYALKTSKIHGGISKTLTSDAKNYLQKRIELDSQNVFRYNHFLNGKNWDHVRFSMNKTKNSKYNGRNILQIEYQNARKIKSDINENVHILHELAKECKTVTEMGVRTGVSTRAFLATDVELKSYDLYIDDRVNKLFEYAKSLGKNAEYIKADVLHINIEETDLLFIDTLHTYSQLKEELRLHGNKAKKYIVFHDTHTFGLRGEVGQEHTGLLSAIIEFVMENPHWKFKIYKINNNGMTVLERMN